MRYCSYDRIFRRECPVFRRKFRSLFCDRSSVFSATAAGLPQSTALLFLPRGDERTRAFGQPLVVASGCYPGRHSHFCDPRRRRCSFATMYQYTTLPPGCKSRLRDLALQHHKTVTSHLLVRGAARARGAPPRRGDPALRGESTRTNGWAKKQRPLKRKALKSKPELRLGRRRKNAR